MAMFLANKWSRVSGHPKNPVSRPVDGAPPSDPGREPGTPMRNGPAPHGGAGGGVQSRRASSSRDPHKSSGLAKNTGFIALYRNTFVFVLIPYGDS